MKLQLIPSLLIDRMCVSAGSVPASRMNSQVDDIQCYAQDKYRMSIGSVWDEYGICMAAGKKRFGKTGVDCEHEYSTQGLRKMVRNGKSE